MAEYISVESIDKDFADQLFRKYPSSYSPGILAAIKEIKRLQVADVRENVRGEWVWYEVFYGDDAYNRYNCSNCGYETDMEYNFCPNCGTDMRRGYDVQI